MKADGSETSEGGTEGRRTARRRVVPALIVAAVATGIWFIFLLVVALRTANPVTVNREQLLASDAVVVAVPDAAADGAVSLKIERSLAGETLTGTLRVGGVEPGRFEFGDRYLVPLSRRARGYVVTPTPTALAKAPLVYPATDDALRAAESILASGAAKPYP